MLSMVVKLVMLDLALCAISLIISPIFVYIHNAKLELIAPFKLPGTSVDLTYDYELNIIYQIFATVIITLSYAFFEMIFVIQILHVNLLTDLMSSKIKALNNITAESKECRVKVNKGLNNVILLHNELLE